MVDIRLLLYAMIHPIFKMLYFFVRKILIPFVKNIFPFVFPGQSSRQSYCIVARFLSQCEVNYMQETNYNNMFPSENLNDVMYVAFHVREDLSHVIEMNIFHLEIIHEIHVHVHSIKHDEIVVLLHYTVKIISNIRKE